MPHLSGFFNESIPGVDMGQVRKAQRVQQVRDMWSHLVASLFLEHTNNVFVFEKDGHREMHVYVDESIYAAELNNQRELIKWRCREEYGEDIEDFHIHISRGKYKSYHPFAQAEDDRPDQNQPAPLSKEEMEQVETTCESIPDERLKACFKKAMVSHLEWRKGNK